MNTNDENETVNGEVVDVEDSTEIRDEQIASLVENDDLLTENSENILKSFEGYFSSDYDFNDVGKLWENLNIVLQPEYEDIDEFADAANALVNVVENLDSEIIILLREEGASDQLITLIRDLKLDYGNQLDREFNRLQKGRNWWSNIKTNAGFRSHRPTFKHELTIDYQDTIVFNSNLHSTFVLIDHFTRQLGSVSELVGDDALLEMDKDMIDTIIDRFEELKEDIEEYEEEIQQVTDAPDGPENSAEGSSTESENQQEE